MKFVLVASVIALAALSAESVTTKSSIQSKSAANPKNEISSRTFKGEKSGIQKVPWIARIALVECNSPDGEKICGKKECDGSLISEQHIITSSYCLNLQPEGTPGYSATLFVLLGMENISATMNTADLAANAKYTYNGTQQIRNNTRIHFDMLLIESCAMGIIKLPTPVTLSKNIFPINITLPSVTCKQTKLRYTAAGYGVADLASVGGSQLLLVTAVVQEMSAADCTKKNGDNLFISPEIKCLSFSSKNMCVGNIGGPIYLKDGNYQRLHGISIRSSTSCIKDTKPIKYINLERFNDWIKWTINVHFIKEI